MKILRPEVEASIIANDSLMALLDNSFKLTFNVTDAEYDYIANNATDEELELLMNDGKASFADKRRMLNTRNRLLKEMQAMETTNNL